MKNTICTALVALLVLPGLVAVAPAAAPLTEDEAARRVASAPRAKADEDALVLFDGLFVSYRDGLAEVRRQLLIRIGTEWAMDTLGDPRLSYDRSRQELVVHTSRTFLLGGGTIDTPDNGYNDVTPDGVARSVDHLDHREMVVTHVGLEPGASVFLDWTVRDTVARETPFHLLVFPHDRFPTRERAIVSEGLRGELVIPEHALFTVTGLRPGGGKLEWSGENLPAAPHPRGDHAGDELPWIALSSSPGWEAALGGVVRDLEAAAAARDGVAAALAALDEEEPFLTDRGTLAAWATRVGERTEVIRHGSWSDLGPLRSAERTLARSLATPLERCALMLAGCRERGLDASVVFPARWLRTTEDVAALESLRSPVLRAVDRAGEAWWLDPVEASVSSQAPFPPGTPCFGAEGAEIFLTRTPGDTSRVDIAVFWDLAGGRAKCEGRIAGPGAAKLSLDAPETLIEEWVSGWTDSVEVEDVRVEEADPARIRFSASAKAAMPEEDERGRVTVTLPLAPLAIDGLLPPVPDATRSECEHVLFSEAPAEVSVRWRLRLPEDRKLLAPRDASAACPGGLLAIRRTGEGSTAEISYRLTWDGRPVEPGAYARLPALLLEAVDARSVTAVLGSREGD